MSRHGALCARNLAHGTTLVALVGLWRACYGDLVWSATRVLRLALLALVLVVRPAVAPASAQLVLLTTGRTLSVTGHEFQGDKVVLHLPNGGQIVAARSLVVKIEPDSTPPPLPPVMALVEAEPKPVLSSRPYAEIIDTMSVRHGVDPTLVAALIEVESSYRADARSPKGAMGLMQLMPATARQYAVSDPYDPRANIEAGTKHLRILLDRYDVTGALAAYNAGEGPVRKFGGVPPYPETRRYVEKILSLIDAAER